MVDMEYQLQQLTAINNACKDMTDKTQEKLGAMAALDLKEIQDKIAKGRREQNLANLSLEAAMGIVNRPLRKQILKARIMSSIIDERELSASNIRKNDEFMHYILSRRQKMQQELDYAFLSGPRNVLDLGDRISKYGQDIIKSFTDQCRGIRLRETIFNFNCHQNDIPTFIADEYYLLPPKQKLPVTLSLDRLQFTLTEAIIRQQEGKWVCLYVNHTIKPVTNQESKITLIDKTIQVLKKAPTKDAINQILANVIGLLHPRARLYTNILLYPQQAGPLIRKKISQLGYNIKNAEDSGDISAEESLAILELISEKLVTSHRYYFEITAPKSAEWKIGFNTSDLADEVNIIQDVKDGFLIFSSGKVSYNDQELRYNDLQAPGYLTGSATFGFVLDKLNGSISMVTWTKKYYRLFGAASEIFNHETSAEQRVKIINSIMKINFSVQIVKQQDEYADKPYIKANFGSSKFALEPPVATRPLNTHLSARNPDAQFGGSFDLKAPQSATAFRVSLKASSTAVKSWSQFPPSAHRKSLSAVIIQRAWRRYRSRKARNAIMSVQSKAACIIQAAVRARLAKTRAIKNRAAFIIQRNWRATMYIKVAVSQCIYKRSIKQLHTAASVVQRTWRSYWLDKNSEFAIRYNTRLQVITENIRKIMHWWRTIRLVKGKAAILARQNVSATTIQRVYRGYKFRKHLRADVRTNLKNIGRLLYANRKTLIKIHAAYVIKRAWRSYTTRKVFRLAVVARKRAATRIQALWRGHYARLYTAARLSYAEGIFLNGVCKSLKACHYIMKMYKPCGIVCPPKKRGL